MVAMLGKSGQWQDHHQSLGGPCLLVHFNQGASLPRPQLPATRLRSRCKGTGSVLLKAPRLPSSTFGGGVGVPAQACGTTTLPSKAEEAPRAALCSSQTCPCSSSGRRGHQWRLLNEASGCSRGGWRAGSSMMTLLVS